MEVEERLYATGEILKPLDDSSASETIEALKAAGVESVAVCLLHSYANSVHEERLGQLLRQQFPKAYVSLSHEILREFREYERTSTTVLNSYVGPIVNRYLVSLEKMLGDAGFLGTFRVMQSNGGVMSAEDGEKNAGDDDGVWAGGRRYRRSRCRRVTRLPSYHLIRYGWDDGQGESHQRLSS